MQGKKVSESITIMNEIVLPNDTNVFGNLMGGRLMYWMDIAAAIAAVKHCNAPCMTASVDNSLVLKTLLSWVMLYILKRGLQELLIHQWKYI